MIGDAISTLMSWLQTAFTWILDGCIYCLTFVAFLIYDGILTAIQVILLAVDLSSLAMSTALNWAGLPTQLIYLINQIGIPAGLIILVNAILIRMALNLIPGALTRI